MSGQVVVTLLREAYYALPDGTAQERTAYILRRRAELERGVDHAPPPIRKRIAGSRPFSQVASSDVEDAIMRRLCGESE